MDRVIPEKLLQAVVDYLATKSYVEVHQIMPQLLNLPKVKEDECTVGGKTE